MSSHSTTIDLQESVLDSASRASPRVSSGISWLASALTPSLGAMTFCVTLFQVLFVSGGARSLFRDSDTGWHIRNGEAILRSLRVPRADSFSYTNAGKPWFSWEWLADIAIGGAHVLAGPAGVAFLGALVIALTVWGTVRLSLSLGGNLFFTAIATVLLLGATSIHWLARPHIFSWLASLAFLAVAEFERRSATRALFWLPALACLWTNLHGSFPLGPGILLVYAAGEWLRGAEGKRSSRRFATACTASLATTFINPYGWHLHEHVISYLRNSYLMDHISEFRSFSFHAPGAIYVELFLAVAILGTLALFRQRAYGPALLGIVLLHLSLYSARHLPTAAVLLLPLSVVALTREAESWPGLRPMLDYGRRVRAIDMKIRGIVPVLLVLAVSLAALVPIARAGRAGFDPARFPVQAANYLQQRGIGHRVFAKDQWGGYLIYRFDGRLKVFLDGRSDFYGEEMLETYAQVMDVKPGWDAVLRQYGVEFVLIPPDHALASVLALSPQWKRAYQDSVATIFERIN